MNTSQWLFWFVVFWTGAAIGSFLNVVIYRLPRGMSLLRPPSHCPSCGLRLTIIDLVPILSWLWLLGRCRRCRRPISPRYPLIELASALLACAAFYLHSPVAAVFVFAICAALLVAFFVDVDHMIIPDQVHVVIAVSGIALDIRWMIQRGALGMVAVHDLVGPQVRTFLWPRSIVGAAVGAAIFVAVAYLAQIVFRKPALGMGDIKLAAAMGTVLGPGYYFLSFFLLAVVIGAAVGVIVLIVQRGRRDRYIPFGPMLAISGIAMALAPEQIAQLVLARFLL